MFGAFTSFGKLGSSLARAIAAAWSPADLTALAAWYDPSDLSTMFNDSAGTTPVATPGTVADSSNPVGLIQDKSGNGHHASQSTSTARPLLSARRNLLTHTEDFGNAVWDKYRCTIGQNATTAPDGTLTADAVVSESGSTAPKIVQSAGKTLPVGSVIVGTYYFKKAEYDWTYVDIYDGEFKFVYFDIDSGVVGSKSSGVVATIEPADNGFFRASISYTTGGGTIYMRNAIVDNDYGKFGADPNGPTGTGNTSHYVWGAQLELGTTATTYQRVTTDSDYDGDPAKFPYYLKFDGTDDLIATASFTAGTLTSAMDCLIAVRRDAGTLAMAGLTNQPQNVFFGVYSQGDNSNPTHNGCGSPVPYVDATQLAGGTGATRGALYSALTAGEWHILEYRGLDLSAWTRAAFGEWGGGLAFNGAQGGILLFESPADPTERDNARAWLAAKVGVTL